MRFHRKTLGWQALATGLMISGALIVFVRGTALLPVSADVNSSSAASNNSFVQTSKPHASRNLSLQPEAFKLSRRLGERFLSSRRDVTVLGGVLILEEQRQPIQIVRRQGERGETVDIAIGVGSLLSWSESEGSKSATGVLSEQERILIERLALDSVDQFVLAQLRGASYYTIARNVRPPDAIESDAYASPLWNIVRIDDPEMDAQKAPISKWRLYYLNVNSGLIDKVVTDLRGTEIEVNFSEWTKQDKETFPTVITWSRQGTVAMELRLNSFSHQTQE